MITTSFIVLEQLCSTPHGTSSPLVWQALGVTAIDYVTGGSIPSVGAFSLLASDMGYRSRYDDEGGIKVYPPILDGGLSMDRTLPLSPGAGVGSFATGQVQLFNADRTLDSLVRQKSTDGRTCRLWVGAKEWDVDRTYWVDPPASTLTPFFTGVAGPWRLETTRLDIPLYDGLYVLSGQVVQRNIYQGNGGLEGGEELKGKYKPLCLGGTREHPLLNVAPVLVNSAYQIYQYHDGPAQVVNVFDGGYSNFVYDGDVERDTMLGSTPAPGHWRTCNTCGLLQMGSKPVFTLTIDAVGQYGGASVLQLARHMLIDILGLDESLVVHSPWDGLDQQLGYPLAGLYLGTDGVQANEALGKILASCALKLAPRRDGTLLPVLIQKPAPGRSTTLDLSPVNVIELTADEMETALNPPPYRWQVGYNPCYTVQQQGNNTLSGAMSDERKALISTAWRQEGAANTALLDLYRAVDSPLIETALLKAEDAKATAQRLVSLWNGQGRLYALRVPWEVGMRADLGDCMHLTWPLDDLASGRLAIVVGESIRPDDITLTVFVPPS